MVFMFLCRMRVTKENLEVRVSHPAKYCCQEVREAGRKAKFPPACRHV